MDDHEQDIHPECDSDDCAAGKRNRYFAGKRMRPMSFEVEQKYLVDRRRLLNRAMHGWGVVYGFDLRFKPVPAVDPGAHNANTDAGKRPRHAAIRIGEGLALDRAGRELMQVNQRAVTARDVYISNHDREWLGANADAASQMPLAPDQGGGEKARPPEVCWLLRVHYAERHDGPVRVKDDCSCERAEWDYLCETVRYSVERVDASRCREGRPCGLTCRCTAGDPCDHCEPCEPHADPLDRGSHQCMSRYLSRLDPDAEHIGMTKDGGQLSFDLANGIALARVGLRWHCGAPEFTAVLDDWGQRRLVKRNDLLFDLIRGCDLTRISAISWNGWHRHRDLIKWGEFAAYFMAGTGKQFKITFSGPVQATTLTVDCFAMHVVVADASGWGEARRVPLADVQLSEPDQGDPAGSTRSATLIFDAEWLADELGEKKKNSLFSRGPSLVEIDVRTDFILDVWGQAVDGSPIGAQPAPTGNGSPGGHFLSPFRVEPRSSP